MLKDVLFTGFDNADYQAIRSEDIRFSPSGRVMALVATNGLIYLFSVDTQARPIRIKAMAELKSDSLYSPHGVDFISERILVVANRGAGLAFYRIPPQNTWTARKTIEVFYEFNAPWFGAVKGQTRKQGERTVLCGTGSVRVHKNRYFVGCNNKSTLSVHPFKHFWRWVRAEQGRIVSCDGLAIPDGIALTRSGDRLAVGEHENQCVVIFREGDSKALCKLTDEALSHPHGICFDHFGKVLFVADAGLRDIHVFETKDDWRTPMTKSTCRITAVSEDAFRKTKASVGEAFQPLEGGIKGVDVDPSGRILATTCQNQMLRFFEIEKAGA